MAAGRGGAQVVATGQAISLTITGALPAFLISALAVQVQADLAIGPAGLGLATSVLFTVSGLSARWLGSVVQAHGVRFGYVLAALLGAVSLTLIATAPSFPVLVLGLAIGGLGNAGAQPSANLLLTQLVGERRLGLAMGIKQSYIPLASLLGGVSVPTIALVFGWRWAIVAGAAFCLVVAAWGGRSIRLRGGGARPAAGEHRVLPRGGLLVLTIGAGIGAAAATALGVFLVDSSVAAGIAPASAGVLLAVCAASSLAIRILLGWAVDRVRRRSLYVLVSNLLLVSVAGNVLMAFGEGALFVCGALLAYLGWSWTGAFHLAIVRDSVGAVASSTGYVQTGLALGAAVGPLGLGLIVEATTYRTAWLVTAGIGLVGALTVRAGRRMVRRGWGLPVRVPRGRPGPAGSPAADTGPAAGDAAAADRAAQAAARPPSGGLPPADTAPHPGGRP